MTKIDSLTGLRLFAALAVFASHLDPPTTLPGVLRTAMLSGYAGVTLVFVLSGFVLTWTYADRMTSPDRASLRDFAVARFARIAPLYLAGLALAFLVTDGVLPERAWLHVFALQTWSSSFDTAYSINPPGWLIGVEAFLYALFPLLLWALLPSSVRRILTVALVSVLALGAATLVVYLTGGNELDIRDPASDHRWLYRTPLTRVPDFLIGMSVALIVLRSDGVKRWASLMQWASVGAILLLMASDALLDSILSWDLAYAPVVGVLIWSLASAPLAPLARVLGHPLLVSGGLVSLAFYLFHFPILELVEINIGDGRVWLMSAASGLVLTLLVSIGAHLAIEVPAQRWLRHLVSSRGSHDLPVILEQEPIVAPRHHT